MPEENQPEDNTPEPLPPTEAAPFTEAWFDGVIKGNQDVLQKTLLEIQRLQGELQARQNEYQQIVGALSILDQQKQMASQGG